MKPAEQQFLRAVLAAHAGPYHDHQRSKPPFAAEIAQGMGQNEKQALRWVEKWDARGWWDYGVSLRSGWFTPEGYEAALAAVEAAPC